MSFPDIVQSAGNGFLLLIIGTAAAYVGYEMLKALVDDMLRNRL